MTGVGADESRDRALPDRALPDRAPTADVPPPRRPLRMWRRGRARGGLGGASARGSRLAAALAPAAIWREHRLFAVAVAAGLGVRLLAQLAFHPALLIADSFGYMDAAVHHALGATRPSGYPLLLFILSPLHSLPLVTAVQHLMGIGIAVIVYATLRHWSLPAWGATLAAAPTLFDSREIMLESAVLPDTLYCLLIVAAVALLLTRRTPATWRWAAAGLLIAWASVVRGNGPAVMAAVLAYLLIRRAGWRAVAASVAAFALPMLAYMGLFYLSYGQFNITNSDGLFLWSRTMSFANCAVIKPPPDLVPLCPDRQPQHPTAPLPAWSLTGTLHERTPGAYLWAAGAWWRHDATPGITARNNTLAMRFALDAVRAQPLAYLRTTAKGVMLTFLATDRSLSFDSLHFTTAPHVPSLSAGQLRALRAYGHTSSNSRPAQPFAYFLLLYQEPVYFPGLVFLAVLAAGLAGVVRGWRRGGGPAALPWAVAAVSVVAPVALAEHAYRYAISAVPLACLAAGLVAAQRRARDRRVQSRLPGAQQGPARLDGGQRPGEPPGTWNTALRTTADGERTAASTPGPPAEPDP